MSIVFEFKFQLNNILIIYQCTKYIVLYPSFDSIITNFQGEVKGVG